MARRGQADAGRCRGGRNVAAGPAPTKTVRGTTGAISAAAVRRGGAPAKSP